MNVEKGIKGFKKIPLEVRFWQKVDRRGEDECWPWNGTVDQHGRGQIYVDGKSVRAPRVSWQIANSMALPDDMQACHSCDNPNCVNPRHIWPGTMSDNIKDAYRKGRVIPKAKRREEMPEKTVCPHGHPFSPENTYINSKGTKVCRLCAQESRRKYQRRRSAARAALQGEPKC